MWPAHIYTEVCVRWLFTTYQYKDIKRSFIQYFAMQDSHASSLRPYHKRLVASNSSTCILDSLPQFYQTDPLFYFPFSVQGITMCRRGVQWFSTLVGAQGWEGDFFATCHWNILIWKVSETPNLIFFSLLFWVLELQFHIADHCMHLTI